MSMSMSLSIALGATLSFILMRGIVNGHVSVPSVITGNILVEDCILTIDLWPK